MRVFCVHPGPLTYSQIFLRLEPIGLELVAAAARQAGHAVRLLDLQVEDQRAYFRTIERWRPDVVAFGCNYLANIPEIVDLAKATKARFPEIFICVGGHSASFTAEAMIEHSARCDRLRAEGRGRGHDAAVARRDRSRRRDRHGSRRGHRRRRGAAAGLCPFARRGDAGARPACVIAANILSAFSIPARRSSFPAAARGIARFAAPGHFTAAAIAWSAPSMSSRICGGSASPGFLSSTMSPLSIERHAMELGEAVARAGIKKRYYLETRGDVLLRNKEVFRFWKTLGLQYLFHRPRSDRRGRRSSAIASESRSAAISRRSNSPARSA